MGLGSHILDSMIWLFGEPASCDYSSDAIGGIESECHLDLHYAEGIQGSVAGGWL